MGDIYLGLMILAGLACGMFQAGRLVARRVSRPSANLLGALTFVGLAAYINGLWDQVRLAQWLPFSNVIVLGNWFPLAAGFLGGLACEVSVRPGLRRFLPAVGLQLAAVVTLAAPFLGSVPDCQDLWHDSGVCLQSTDKTCSAASAATLLKLHGITATEQEMAELCLTRNGTHWMGVYRGLKLKTAGTAWVVEPFECSADQLLASQEPAMLCVGIPAHGQVDPIYRREWGWTPGVRHSVVLLGFTAHGRLAEVAEPSLGVGRERWTADQLRTLYRGQGLRLVRRSGK